MPFPALFLEMLLTQIVRFILLFLLGFPGRAEAVGPFTGLNDNKTHLPVRQEKALNLLLLWRFISPEFADCFSIDDANGLTRLQQAHDYLTLQADKVTTGDVSSPAQHYLTAVLVKMQILDSLDFSEGKLREFFYLNPRQYSCNDRAVVSELFIPNSYLAEQDTSAVLQNIRDSLTTGIFGRVAYEVNSRLGTPSTGFKGSVTRELVGNERFQFYEEVFASGINRRDGKVGGPFRLPNGYLFVEVRSLLSGKAACYEYYRDRVVQDYGREWLKKSLMDTLTTMTNELQPHVVEPTTGTALQDVAYTVANHKVTFQEARATLPFLTGDVKTLAFWKSVQGQALEVEILYHSRLGENARKSYDFKTLSKVLTLIKQANDTINSSAVDEPTTESIIQFYNSNKERYSSIGNLSYILFSCRGKPVSEQFGACAGRLEKLRNQDPNTSLANDNTSEILTGIPWSLQSRERQVATQALQAGEWSEVFSEDGIPKVLFLTNIKRELPNLSDIWAVVKNDLLAEQRQKFWSNFAGLENRSENRPLSK